MTIPELEHYSKDDLVAELINRQTFVGVVVYHRSDCKGGKIEPEQIVTTKSPPLTREGTEQFLRIGLAQLPSMFGEENE